MISTAALRALFQTGELLETRSNLPLTLDDPYSAWLVEEGDVDVFAVQMRSDGVVITRGLIGTSSPGDLLLGGSVSVDGDSAALRAVGMPRAKLRRLPLEQLRTAAVTNAADGALPAAVNRWLSAVGACIAKRAPTAKIVLLEPGHTLGIDQGSMGVARHEPVWVDLDEGVCPLLGSNTIELRPSDPRLP
jgi:hypothetical protein